MGKIWLTQAQFDQLCAFIQAGADEMYAAVPTISMWDEEAVDFLLERGYLRKSKGVLTTYNIPLYVLNVYDTSRIEVTDD